MQFDLEKSIGVLGRTPATITSLLDQADESWIQAREGPKSFSPFDVVGHLIDGEETDWIPRSRHILKNGAQTPFEPYDRFRHVSRNAHRELPSLLAEFGALRATNLATLRGWCLTDRELDLEGQHPEFGRVTLRQLLSAWVVHDLGHIAQIVRVMAKEYTSAVGPWFDYLPVLSDRRSS